MHAVEHVIYNPIAPKKGNWTVTGNGNGLSTLWRKLYFYCIPTSGGRSKYINNHKYLFHHVGENLFFQPRKFPSDPELISFGNNVMIASEVSFITHDIVNSMISRCGIGVNIKNTGGVIEIGNNVMVGAKSIIMPNVRIGNNVVIAAGSIVTKDIPNNSVVGGIPAKVIGSFQDLVNKRKNSNLNTRDTEELWKRFYESRGNTNS